MKSNIVILAMIGQWICSPSALARDADDCGNMMPDGKVLNQCTEEVVFFMCGTNPKSGAGMDCKKRIGNAGVRPGKIIIDSNDYSAVFWLNCGRHEVLTNVKWTSAGLSGNCRR